jgi:site-specific DNA-methyltransferase (adenine-specific)
MFPEELPRRLLKLFSYRGDLVLDPFNGAGTTTLAAWKNDRRFIGIDISPEYCKEALSRIRHSGMPAGAVREPDIVVIGD